MSDSGYCRKRETQQARTEMSVINMSNVTISNKVQKTDEKGVQTCDTITSNGKDTDTVRRLTQLWAKCYGVLIGIILFGLVLYYVENSTSYMCTQSNPTEHKGSSTDKKCKQNMTFQLGEKQFEQMIAALEAKMKCCNGTHMDDKMDVKEDTENGTAKTTNEQRHVADNMQSINEALETHFKQLHQTLSQGEQRIISSNNKLYEFKQQNELTYKLKLDELEKEIHELRNSNEHLKKENHNLNESEYEFKEQLKASEHSKQIVEKELESAREAQTQADRKLTETILEQNRQLDEVKLNMNKNEDKLLELRNTTTKLRKENLDLKARNEKYETSLSELMAATGARSNSKLTKMEHYSHEKLAVGFGEIYTEEYSNADDELRMVQSTAKEKNTEKFFLNIVKRAYELCSTYANEHKRSINESLTGIYVETAFKDENQIKNQESVRVSINDPMSTLELDTIANLTLSTLIRLQEPIVEVLSEIIASDFEIEAEKQPNLMNYVRKCLELCWMMNMHSHPIVVKFEDTTDPVIFDRKTYKTYENDGEFLDFVVWPPVYAYEGGKLISKGIAEGTDSLRKKTNGARLTSPDPEIYKNYTRNIARIVQLLNIIYRRSSVNENY